MEFGNVFETAVIAVIAALVLFNVLKVRGARRGEREARERGEALFRSMFPDLQPWFHPRKVIEHVKARRGKTVGAADDTWPEFEGAPKFSYEDKPDGAVLRIGKGKMTVVLPADGQYRVRYWHPDREFKWKRSGDWTFNTRMADSEMHSSSDSSTTTFGDSSSSSRSSTATAAAAGAAAGMAAGAGAFDGGGASSAWDGGSDGGGGSDSAADAFAGSSAGATSY